MPEPAVSEKAMPGPLAPFASDVAFRLQMAGYAPPTSKRAVRVVAHLSNWLSQRDLEASDIDGACLDLYRRDRVATGCFVDRTRPVLRILCEAMVAAGCVPRKSAFASRSATDVLLLGFERHLLEERGVVSTTAGSYVAYARRFLAELPTGDIATVTPADVTAAVLREAGSHRPGSTHYFLVGLRAFLRFVFAHGVLPTNLSGAVLAVSARRGGLPARGITHATADALLRSCDRTRPAGVRDYAILLTLIRLGLRSGEVAALDLDDVNWRAGQLVIHGKGAREDQLPLPDDVGQAIASYLQSSRPASHHREVFLRLRAPIGPVSGAGLNNVVGRACSRAGVTPIGPHRLRHTLACDMVAAAIPLADIGQVLRHASIETTAIYARVDPASLRALALPWPGSAA